MTVFFPLSSPNLKHKLWKIHEDSYSFDISCGATEGEYGAYMSNVDTLTLSGTPEQLLAIADAIYRELKPQQVEVKKDVA